MGTPSESVVVISRGGLCMKKLGKMPSLRSLPCFVFGLGMFAYASAIRIILIGGGELS